jgi:hypothetical protein
MSWIRAAGVDVVSVSWWGQGSFEDGNSRAVLDAAASSGVQVNFMIEAYGGRTAQTVVSDIRYLYDRFGTHPAFFRSTRPTLYGNSTLQRGVFFLFGPDGSPGWSQALDSIRNTPYDAIVLVRGDDGKMFSDADVRSQLAVFHCDGFFNVGAYDYVYNSEFPRSSDYIVMYAASPGFDNTRSPSATTPLQVPRRKGAFYDDAWSALVRERPEWVSVDSFNEWHETTQIEPATRQSYGGYTYLDYEGHYNLTGAEAEQAYITRTAYWTGQYKPLADPGRYAPVSPTRILDTRDGTGGVRGKLGPNQTLQLRVAGMNGVDASASAAVINLTVDGATAPSYLTIYPSGQPTPMVSNLNFQPGQVVANLTHVAIGAGGAVSIYNAQGWVDVVLDLNGFFTLGGALGSGLFRALPPTRLLDTRLSGLRLGPGQTIDLRVGGAGSVPYPGAAATVLNLTATGANQGSYLTLFPTGQSRPLASNVNFPAGRDVPNRAIAKLGSGGKVSIYNAVGWVDVVVDLGGWFTDSSNPGAVGGLYHPQRPSRVLDTRLQGPALGEGSVRNLPLGLGGAAVVLNVTSVNPSSGSFITVYPSDGSMPLASDLNLVVGQDIPNLVEVKLGSDGGVKLYNALGQTQMVADLQGWYG